MLNTAFISAVEDRNDKRLLLVRARRKGDIGRVFGKRAIGVKSDIMADYPYRTWVSKKLFKRVLAESVDRIDYGNFKSSVKDRALHDAYLDVWSAMMRVEKRRRYPLFADYAKLDPYLPEHDDIDMDEVPLLDSDDDIRDFLALKGFALR
jgi:hypothetical protein